MTMADLTFEMRKAFADDLNIAVERFARGEQMRAFRRLTVLVAILADVETDGESFWAEPHPDDEGCV